MPARVNFNKRLHEINHFYQVLNELQAKLEGTRTLAEANGNMSWPRRSVYFFFEPGEERATSGSGQRVVRVGTHALIAGSKTTLWKRLSTHQGTQKNGGGNHRASVFRHHVGTALIKRDDWPSDIASVWGRGSSAKREIPQKEHLLEVAVSDYIRIMPFLWIEVDDEPGPDSDRGYLERSSIALLSNYHYPYDPVDPPSSSWLGSWAANEAVRRSGLWNDRHTNEPYDPAFLESLEYYINLNH